MTSKHYVPSKLARAKPRKTYGSYHGNQSRIFHDAMIEALPPGWRKSQAGNWYYEARINRADNKGTAAAGTAKRTGGWRRYGSPANPGTPKTKAQYLNYCKMMGWKSA